MKLSFLGQTYEAPTPEIAATTTNEALIFRGKSYAQKQYSVQQRQQPASELTYRGIKYTA